MARQSVPARKTTVCLLAGHPLVLSEFHRLLSKAPFRVEPKKVDALPTQPNGPKVPFANVYVIDYSGVLAATVGLVQGIVERYPSARILLVGDHFDDSTAFPLLQLGVKGLLEHTQLVSQMEHALQAVANGGYWVPRALLSRFVEFVLSKSHARRPPSIPTQLSRREKEVVDGLLENLSNKEIAIRLNISERTVKFHVSNLLGKFGVGRRADLIVLCYQDGARSMAFLPQAGSATGIQ